MGVVLFERGSGSPILKEVSLVARSRVAGAQIISKNRLPDLPAARANSSSRPAAPGEVILGGQHIRRCEVGRVLRIY
jgi:hypothetical protein